VSLGVFFGLVIGKPLGIVLASLISVKVKIASLSQSINLKKLIGAGILGGIGFTMAIFVDNLAFTDPELIGLGKVSILIASTICAVIGTTFLAQKN
jgi:NhaA family Na+:H+ antiporter